MDITYLLDAEGRRIRPAKRIRSKSGNHGEDIYELSPT